MRALSSLAIGLSLVSGFLFLALVAELYYLLWWKKRTANREIDEQGGYSTPSPARELLYLFCWKKPNSLSSTALNPQQICSSVTLSDDSHNNKDLLMPFGEEGMEAELMRLHSLSGPPRFLFTIKEETKEDLESEDGKSRKGGRSLSDVLLNVETPFMTPLSSPPFFTPPLTPVDCRYNQQGFNPLFESGFVKPQSSSPPPKFKFLRDAEDKLYKKTLKEEAMKVHKIGGEGGGGSSSSKGGEEEDGSFITIIIGKSKQQSSSSSQVIPLPSSPPPSITRPAHGKLGSYLSSSES